MVAYFLERFLGFGAGFVGARRSTLRISRSNAQCNLICWRVAALFRTMLVNAARSALEN
jgi:hypothetical protein